MATDLDELLKRWDEWLKDERELNTDEIHSVESDFAYEFVDALRSLRAELAEANERAEGLNLEIKATVDYFGAVKAAIRERAERAERDSARLIRERLRPLLEEARRELAEVRAKEWSKNTVEQAFAIAAEAKWMSQEQTTLACARALGVELEETP